MVDRAKKPSALATTPGLPPQPQINITHDNSRISASLPTGESVEILLYGATVISWKTGSSDGSGPKEQLWLSEAANLDGSKAIRGGIPVVFPVFGQDETHTPTKQLPQHGFARTSRWEFLGKSTSESSSGSASTDEGIKLDFGLSQSNLDAEAKKAWPQNFGLIYSVTLSREGLGTTMLVRNEGEEAWDFQLLMHTYLRIKDIEKIAIQGLAQATYFDKVLKSSNTEEHSLLPIQGRTDRIYTPQGGPSTKLSVIEDGKVIFEIVRDNLENAVVWNPWTTTDQIGDFEPKNGYKNMICVEAGQVKGWLKLEAGETFEGGQIIKASL